MDECMVSWADLPTEFKSNVARLLDLKSRNSLQLCSKADWRIVESCPVVLERFQISSHYHDFLRKTTIFNLKRSSWNSRKRLVHQEKNLDRKKAIDEIIHIFKNKHSVVNQVKIQNGRNMENFMHHLLLRIRNLEMKQRQIVRIRAKEVEWSGAFRTEYVYFMQFLKYFDISHLKSIKIESFYMSRDAVERLVATEQFKNAKEVCIQPMIKLPMDFFLHLDTVEICSSLVKSEDVWKLIKNFQSKQIPNNCGFTLTSEEQLPPKFKTEVFDFLGIPYYSEERNNLSTDPENYIVKFPVYNSFSCLLVKFDIQSVFGVIAGKDFINKLTIDISIYMNLRQFGFDWASDL